MGKQVFNTAAFVAYSVTKKNFDPNCLRASLNGWCIDCEGKTEEEMKAMGYCSEPEWFVKVEGK